MVYARYNRSLILIFSGLLIGSLIGAISVRLYDKHRESLNYLGRKCIESKELMYDLNNNDTDKVSDKLNTRLDYSALIINLFVNDGRAGKIAQSALSDIYRFRLKYPHEIHDPEIKLKMESALTVGKNFDPSSKVKAN